MKLSKALLALAELSASQWGMVTAAQAAARGIDRLDLSRLADAGQLVRLVHGVYRDAGAPGDEFEDLRAAWLSTDPGRLAEERLAGDLTGEVVITGASAAWLHGIGDLPADRHEFSAPVRRQSQRKEMHYRQRVLEARDVTVAHGLPVTSRERTIASLVEARTDMSLVGDVMGDAARKGRLDLDRLAELLAPLAARHGFGKGEGAGLLERLKRLAGLDLESLAARIASSQELGALVTSLYLGGASNMQTNRESGSADVANLVRDAGLVNI